MQITVKNTIILKCRNQALFYQLIKHRIYQVTIVVNGVAVRGVVGDGGDSGATSVAAAAVGGGFVVV